MPDIIHICLPEEELVITFLHKIKITFKNSYISERNNKKINEILAYLIENFNDPQCRVATMKKHLMLTSHSTTEIFHCAIGISPKNFLKLLRIWSAIIFIRENIQLKNIPYYTGFRSFQNLNNAFKEILQHTPKDLQKNFDSIFTNWFHELDSRKHKVKPSDLPRTYLN